MVKGYIFGLGSDADVSETLRDGRFTVRQQTSGAAGSKKWNWQMLETFADFQTMAPGDRVFFFQNRRIFGVGTIRELNGRAAVTWNDEQSEDPQNTSPPGPISVWFEPGPAFFDAGLDMDEVLSLREAGPDWGLRFFWKRSFVQIGEDETLAILGALIRRNARVDWIANPTEPPSKSERSFSFSDIIRARPDLYVDDGKLRTEAALHGVLAEVLVQDPGLLGGGVRRPERTYAIFHEVPASPPKPADYIDRIDLVLARAFTDSPVDIPHHYDVIECKKDGISGSGNPASVIGQLLKYVDYTASMRCGGDYDSLSGHYIASGYANDFIDRLNAIESGQSIVARPFVTDPHDEQPVRVWDDLHLWTYRWETVRGLVLEKTWPSL